MREIIVQSMGYFDEKADKDLCKIVKECGYNSVFDLEARLDERIIKFLKDRTNTHNKKTYYKSKGEGSAYLVVDKVDTHRMWIIDEYDSAESIAYIDMVNEELNLFKLSSK